MSPPNKAIPKDATGRRIDEAWKQGIFDIYARMRQRPTPCEIVCCGHRLTVMEDVYAPDFFTDSAWYAQELARLVGNASLLEIGTGTGVIAIHCEIEGAHVVATDVNPAAIVNARANATRLGARVSVREGNLYEPLDARDRFDFIFWAHPFNNWPLPGLDMLLRSGIDPHYEALSGYIAGARYHLEANGTLLLGTGDSANLEAIANIARNNGYRLHELKRVRMPLAYCSNDEITYLIYALVNS